MPAEVDKQPGGAFFVIMTRGHASDLPVLARVLATRSAPFLGVIGSAQKARVLRRNLREQGFDEKCIASFHCPLGLPIGNNTPPEIAISTTAHLLQVRDQRTRQAVGNA
jgi:xanthine dehydrogenase accessory factor